MTERERVRAKNALTHKDTHPEKENYGERQTNIQRQREKDREPNGHRIKSEMITGTIRNFPAMILRITHNMIIKSDKPSSLSEREPKE